MAPAFQQGDSGGSAIGTLVPLVVGIYMIACLWMIFSKAGEAGWQSIIPIWNTIVLLKIAGKPWWWILLMFVPLLNIVIWILAIISLGNSFGKSAGFSILLLMCFAPIGMGILAFGGDRYLGPGGARGY
jgi:hypothetical protein